MNAVPATNAPTYDAPYTRCPLCRSDRIELYHRDFRGNRIFRCRDCRVQFLNPVYTDEYLARFYSSAGATDTAGDEISAGQERTNRIKFRAIKKFLPVAGNVLDFGCGNGNFIRAALANGWRAVGYDVDCDSTRRAAKRLGVDVRCGSLGAIDWPAASFDLVHAHHVVEHLKFPVADLCRLNRWLKPGGYFYVGVPNIDALASRLKFRLEKLKIRRQNIGRYYDSDHHVFYFSPASMRALLERCGFRVCTTMSGNKSHIGDTPVAQFFSYTLRNYLYTGSAFFMIARKIRDA